MSFLSNLFGNKSAPKPIALSENSREGDSLFLQFENNEARRTYGGSAFIELQCCRLDTDVISDCVNIDNITHWHTDSLYVYFDRHKEFLNNYAELFGMTVHNDCTMGAIDPYGINYIHRNRLPAIIDRIEKAKPADYKILLEWLTAADGITGIYILGI